MTAGTINTNLAIDLVEGRYFLRVNEGKALLDVEREASVVEHLSARGVPTPPAVRAASGEPWLAWRGCTARCSPGYPARCWGGRRWGRRMPGRPVPASPGCIRPGQTSPIPARDVTNRPRSIAGSRPWAGAAQDPELKAAAAELGPELARLGASRVPTCRRADPRRPVHRQRPVRRRPPGRAARLRAGLLGAAGLRPGGHGAGVRLRARRFPPRAHARGGQGVRRHADPDPARARRLRRRAAFRRLPFRCHSHHRRAPAPERRGAPGQGLPPLPPAADGDRSHQASGSTLFDLP